MKEESTEGCFGESWFSASKSFVASCAAAAVRSAVERWAKLRRWVFPLWRSALVVRRRRPVQAAPVLVVC